MFTMKTVYTLPKSRILLLLFALTLTAFSGAFSVSAQTPQVGDYRSRTTGNWTAPATWEYYNGTTWVSPSTTYPGQNAIVGTGAVTIQAGHNVTANFPTSTTILYNNLAAVTTPNPIGKLTINNGSPTGGTLTLPGQSNNEIIFYIKTPEISVIHTSGTIYFSNKADLALPTDAVVSLSTGGLTGNANANVKIYIGSLWYAVGTSNSAQYTFAELMAGGGTINAIINQPINNPITICHGTPVLLQGSFSGTYGTVLNVTPTTTNTGVTYKWYNGQSTTTPIYSGTISLPNTPTPISTNEHVFTPNTPGTYTLTFRVETWFDGVMYYNEETRTIVVRPTPTATISVSPNTVCQGSTSAPIITFTNTQALDELVIYNINGINPSTINVPANSTATVTVPTTTAGTFTYNLVSVQYQTEPNCPNNITGQSATVTVNPNAAIALTSGSSNQTLCANTALTPITYSVTGGGTGATVSGLPSGVTGSYSGGFFTISGTPTVSGTFNYTVTTTGTCTQTTATGTITVNPTTTITSQSTATQTVCQNSSFSSISVTATGHNLSYQWYSNTTNSNSGGTSITGATNSSYTPASTSPGTLYYYCVVNGTCGTATSAVSGAFTVTPLTTITTQPVSKEVCPGTDNVSLSVAATGTGTLTYQWHSNTTASNSGGTSISGATSATYTTTKNDFGTYYYYCVVTGNCGFINSDVAIITVSNTATTWTGNTNTNWNEVGNWSCGIPIATSNVTIPASLTNYPVVNITSAVCNNLSIADGASLTVNPGQLLTVGGTITGAETAVQAGKIRVKAASDGTTANGSLIINCDNNSTIIGGVRNLNKIYGTVEFYTKALKDENAATWTDVIPGSPTNGVTFNTKYKWQFFGVPVKEVVANPTFYGSFLRKYREDMNSTTTAKWEVLNNTSKLEAFKGYEITQAAAKMIEIAGELQFCDKTLTLTRLAPLTVGGVNFGLGQNIFGNSYTAAIKISQMIMPEVLDQTVYLYNTGSLADWAEASLIESPTNSTTMVAGSYISIPKNASGAVWDEIPSMQGFLLKYLPANTIFEATPDAQVTLKYANGGVVGNTKPQLAPQAAEEPLSYLRVNLQSKTTTDNLWLFSREGTSSNFDNGWDGHKHFGTPTAFIYSMTPDGPMQVNTDRTIDGSVINFYANSDTEYTLTLVKSNLDAYSDLKLIDFGTKTVTPLTAEMTRYNFSSSNAGVVEKRFMIVNSASKIDFKKNDFSLLYGYLSADKTLIVTNFSGEPGTMTLSTASGVTVMNETLTTGTSHFPTSLRAGAYILTMEAGTSRASIKVLINNK